MISRDLFDIGAMRVLKMRDYYLDHSSQELVVFIADQRHPVRVPVVLLEGSQEARFKYISDELKRRQRSKIFADNRHAHFKGFREVTA